MAKTIGIVDKGVHVQCFHVQCCPKCRMMFSFTNSEILKDEMGLSIFCPNCGKEIKF